MNVLILQKTSFAEPALPTDGARASALRELSD
jgi:hypothetical protein